VDQKRNRQRQKNQDPAPTPNATTQDQVANMESEGQAQQPGQEPPAGVREELAEVSRKSNKKPARH
jgi:hypothetical protein